MVIKILIHKDRLILNSADRINELSLSQFGYDYNKPIKEKVNHFINTDLIKKVKSLIKPCRSVISRLFLRDRIFVGIDSRTDSVAIRHHSDFAELIGINNPRIVVKSISDIDNQDLRNIIKCLDSEKYMLIKETNRIHF